MRIGIDFRAPKKFEDGLLDLIQVLTGQPKRRGRGGLGPNLPSTNRILPCAVVVVVNVRHHHGGGVAKDFRVVKLCATRIAMRPEDLAHRVAKPGPPAALPTAKVSRVLVQDYREDAFGHVIPDNKVGVGSAEVLRISFNTLPERTITVAELALARKCRGECECATVEGVLSGNSELLARRR
jgi:hypothetical protein